MSSLKNLILVSSAALVLSLVAAPKATAGHAKVRVNVNLGHTSFGYSRGYRHRPYRPVCAPIVVAPLPVYCPAPVICPPPVYVPVWHIENERVWVAPVYQDVLAGYDACGRPIYRQACVTPGYWRTAQYRVSDCGERVFVCYLP